MDNGKDKITLIEIYNVLDEKGKPVALQWIWNKERIDGAQAEQILKTVTDIQTRRNIKKEILEEINKTKIIKPGSINANLRI